MHASQRGAGVSFGPIATVILAIFFLAAIAVAGVVVAAVIAGVLVLAALAWLRSVVVNRRHRTRLAAPGPPAVPPAPSPRTDINGLPLGSPEERAAHRQMQTKAIVEHRRRLQEAALRRGARVRSQTTGSLETPPRARPRVPGSNGFGEFPTSAWVHGKRVDVPHPQNPRSPRS
jgi:hypothetical protein